MHRLIALLVLLAVPGLGFASGGAHLLGRQLTLTLGQTGAGPVSADELTPPPPPPPSEPLPEAIAPGEQPLAEQPGPESAAPSADLGLAAAQASQEPPGGLGFLISGSVVGGVGMILLLESIVVASSSGMGSVVGPVVLAVIHLAIGVPLFIVGLNRQVARGQYFEQHPEVTWLQPGTNGRIAVLTF